MRGTQNEQATGNYNVDSYSEHRGGGAVRYFLTMVGIALFAHGCDSAKDGDRLEPRPMDVGAMDAARGETDSRAPDAGPNPRDMGRTDSANPPDAAAVDECATGAHNCDPNAVCTDTNGGFECACSAGFEGDGRVCTDVDECATNNGGCAQVCNNAAGTFACACNDGYVLNADSASCDDVDECSGVDCGPGGACTEADGETVAGQYTCTCAAGHEGGGVNTPCQVTRCAENEYVSANVCTACPPGTTNAAEDDASQVDTMCDATLCAAGEYVAANACMACPAGTTNAVGDDASQADTMCNATLCAANE